jgi:hypothetical protein
MYRRNDCGSARGIVTYAHDSDLHEILSSQSIGVPWGSANSPCLSVPRVGSEETNFFQVQF